MILKAKELETLIRLHDVQIVVSDSGKIKELSSMKTVRLDTFLKFRGAYAYESNKPFGGSHYIFKKVS